mmetsp:Transcript_25860/g.63646  ORF Transcript_25860/g.63646 Transcript_25860/m.63646 type:complete len:473 (+) Transcript_25860:201-1619(+)
MFFLFRGFMLAIVLIAPGAAFVEPANFIHETADLRRYGTRCSALFRGKYCQLQKAAPTCFRRVFSGSWLSMHAEGTSGISGPGATRDPWLESLFSSNRHVVLEKLKKSLPLGDTMNFTVPLSSRRAAALLSCALVGSGSELLGSGLGPTIDQHDVVVRLNRAPVQGFERDVGSFTTLRYTNNLNEGFREFINSEAVISSKWCSSGPPCDRKNIIQRLGGKKVHGLNPAFVAYARRDTFAAEVGHNPSSGFVATLLLLHLCHSVSILGFSVIHIKSQMKHWYYDHAKRLSPLHDIYDVADLYRVKQVGAATDLGDKLRGDKINSNLRLSSRREFRSADEKIFFETEAAQSTPNSRLMYDKLWWDIEEWSFVTQNTDLHKFQFQHIDSDVQLRSDPITMASLSLHSSSSQGRRRRILAQSLFFGHEKKCLRLMHEYGLIHAKDGVPTPDALALMASTLCPVDTDCVPSTLQANK